MGNAKDTRPVVKPVTKVELNDENKYWRIAAVAVLVILGIALIAWAGVKLLGTSAGYVEIKAEDSIFADFFTFNYDIGASGVSASAEYRLVSEAYTSSLNKYCRIFSSDTNYTGVKNIAYINAHPGENIKIDPALYSALQKMENEGEGRHYLGISLEIYDALFSSSGDEYAVDQDPTKNAELKAINLKACEFARDRSAVSLSLLGDNTVRLNVSEEYAAFATKYEFTRYIDLGVFENAFIIDAICDVLISKDMTLGAISSYDGYARNLDTREMEYSFSFYAKGDEVVYPVCDVEYSGGIATYIARTYPVSGNDVFDYYLYSSGESAHRFIDPTTGEYKSCLDEILLASSSKDCFSLALLAYSTLVSDSLNESDLADVNAMWVNGNIIKHMGNDLLLSSPYSDENINFAIEKVN